MPQKIIFGLELNFPRFLGTKSTFFGIVYGYELNRNMFSKR